MSKTRKQRGQLPKKPGKPSALDDPRVADAFQAHLLAEWEYMITTGITRGQVVPRAELQKRFPLKGRTVTMIIQDETDHPPEIPREVVERFIPKAVLDACKPPLKDR